MGRFYGRDVYQPAKILCQIIAMQALFSASLLLCVYVLAALSDAPFAPQSLLDGGSLTVFSAQGWCRIGGLFATALASAACMPIIVERSKKAVDFAFTVYFLHGVACATLGQAPTSGTWWVTHVCAFIFTAALGEYLCMRREMQDITVEEVLESAKRGRRCCGLLGGGEAGSGAAGAGGAAAKAGGASEAAAAAALAAALAAAAATAAGAGAAHASHALQHPPGRIARHSSLGGGALPGAGVGAGAGASAASLSSSTTSSSSASAAAAAAADADSASGASATAVPVLALAGAAQGVGPLGSSSSSSSSATASSSAPSPSGQAVAVHFEDVARGPTRQVTRRTTVGDGSSSSARAEPAGADPPAPSERDAFLTPRGKTKGRGGFMGGLSAVLEALVGGSAEEG